jgi:xylan 1,4-beta-xylosidase
MFDLADREKTNIAGMLTWAFEFENQPYFEGFRTLATNGIDKPILNLFRMTARMHGDRVAVDSSAAVPVAAIQSAGVRGPDPDVDAIAARSDRDISILIWNYHDDDLPGPDASVQLQISGLPAAAKNAKNVMVRHYRIDETHSNAWTAWKKMGSPQQPTPEQYKALEAAGRLQELKPPVSVSVTSPMKLDLQLPRQGLSLLQLSW